MPYILASYYFIWMIRLYIVFFTAKQGRTEASCRQLIEAMLHRRFRLFRLERSRLYAQPGSNLSSPSAQVLSPFVLHTLRNVISMECIILVSEAAKGHLNLVYL